MQIALAAAWIVLSLAVGSLMTADAAADDESVVPGISTTARP